MPVNHRTVHRGHEKAKKGAHPQLAEADQKIEAAQKKKLNKVSGPKKSFIVGQ